MTKSLWWCKLGYKKYCKSLGEEICEICTHRRKRRLKTEPQLYKIRCLKCKWFKKKDGFCNEHSQYPDQTNPRFAIACDAFEKRKVK